VDALTPAYCQTGHERGHLGFTHLAWMAPAVVDDEPANPMNVCLFRPAAVVSKANRLADPIEQLDFHPTTMASSSS
jgi:hypothetical protein